LNGTNALKRSGVRGHFFGQSSFSTLCLATLRNLVRVPDDLELAVLAPLGCGLQTGAATVMNFLKVPQGASIAVFGTGAVGCAAIMAAVVVGASPIIGVDINPARLEVAAELGATHVIDSRECPLPSRISRITGGGVDYVVETTGDWEMTGIAGDVLNRRGIAALLAGGGATPLSGGRRTTSVIQGDAVPQLFIPQLISLYRAGRFPFDRLIRFYPFHEINGAITDARRGDTIKPVLRVSEP
jgi:aryl-alcohol dehydrogenase